jgi:hypothetical protein
MYFFRSFILWLSLIGVVFAKQPLPHESGFREVAPSAVGYVSLSSCPVTRSGWKDWRNRLRLVTDLGQLVEAIDFLKNCSGQKDQKVFFEEPNFFACMKPILEMNMQYLEQTSVRPGFNAMKAPTIQIPSEFMTFEKVLKLNPNNQSNSNEHLVTANDLIAANPGVKGLSFQSSFIGERLSFVVPQSNPDHRLALIVLANKVDAIWTNKKTKQVLFFEILPKVNERFASAPDPEDKILLQSETMRAVATLKNQMLCSACHPNGYNQIVDHESFSEKGLGLNVSDDLALSKYNSYLKGAYRGLMATAKNATSVPEFGSAAGDFQAKYFDQCMSFELAQDKSKVLSAMSCTDCHSRIGKALALKFPFDHPEQSQIILNHVLNKGVMPPPNNKDPHSDALTDEERLALRNCLDVEYYGRLSKLGNRTPEWEGLLLRSIFDQKCKL